MFTNYVLYILQINYFQANRYLSNAQYLKTGLPSLHFYLHYLLYSLKSARFAVYALTLSSLYSDILGVMCKLKTATEYATD